ncbi:alanine racemase [Aliidiomarina minuta]|uniref:Alanine racemase n=1 Tax=Aliidiomarina minuta TaxID=880057 RepID=A0A432W1P4_9GAMM|nr:alanine racemase [Aliidiomarina minuta]RUO23036.1 alanine racemase [Aliidiomarina minuta]
MRPAWAAIDLKALQHNLRLLREKAGHRQLLAILKANAYGHGLTRIAAELQQADAIGVARVDEALALRQEGIVKPIVLLEGFFEPSQLAVLAASQIQTVIHTEHQLVQLERAELNTPLKVWLKVDTGMHRIGVEPEETVAFYRRLQASDNVDGDPILMTHFASADTPEVEQNQQQLAVFNSLQDSLQARLSISNSAAFLADLAPQDNWVRPGLVLYGVSPFADRRGQQLGLKPVMTLQASIISTREIDQGESVGYGAAWTARHKTRIGILAIGYGDGYPRNAPEGTPVWIEGRCYPLVGRVSMDMLAVDLGLDSDIEIGATGVLWGPQLPVEEVAEHVGTISHELLCNVARRVVLDYGDEN